MEGIFSRVVLLKDFVQIFKTSEFMRAFRGLCRTLASSVNLRFYSFGPMVSALDEKKNNK